MKIVYKEGRKLVKVKVMFNGNRGWTLSWNSTFKSFYGTPEEFTKLLRKINAKDNLQSPNSFRSITYSKITQEIMAGTDNIIWVWQKDLERV